MQKKNWENFFKKYGFKTNGIYIKPKRKLSVKFPGTTIKIHLLRMNRIIKWCVNVLIQNHVRYFIFVEIIEKNRFSKGDGHPFEKKLRYMVPPLLLKFLTGNFWWIFFQKLTFVVVFLKNFNSFRFLVVRFSIELSPFYYVLIVFQNVFQQFHIQMIKMHISWIIKKFLIS